MNPIEASKRLETTLQNYVRQALPLERAVPEMTVALEEMYSEHRLVQDPYMEIQPPYKAGESLQQLADDKVIRRKTADIFAKAFLGPEGKPKEFILYSHQANAVRAVCGEDKNLVVCSGTGSGKTECFLIPLIDHLVSQWEDQGKPGQLASGVQSMILYPMNALVNDQIRRLREILKYTPFIRFGKYTGELAQVRNEGSVQDALFDDHRAGLQGVCNGPEWSGAGFDNEMPLRNEVTRRSVWTGDPANILVTNYSMLERLLLLPETSSLFDNPWKYIVLDEAHCYDGALGTEIAWLIRRLQKRVGTPDSLRFLATSATLIDDPDLTSQEKAEQIRQEFASQIFPAKACSFHIGFGSPAKTSCKSARTWSHTPAPESYTQLTKISVSEKFFGIFQNIEGISAKVMELPDDASLLEATQSLFGLESWVCHVKEELELIPKKQSDLMAIGDAMHLLRTVDSVQKSGFLTLGKLGECSLFSEQTSDALCVLKEFLVAGIGPLNILNYWREYLHDPADPNPSSEENDTHQPTANGPKFQNRMGNRLHILHQWKKLQGKEPPDSLTVEGLKWLMKCSEELMTNCSDQQMEVPRVMDAAVVLSEHAYSIIKRARSLVDDLANLVKRARGHLLDEWKRGLNTETVENQGSRQSKNVDSIEKLLVWYLGENPHFLRMEEHLQKCMENGELADEATFKKTAAHLFPDIGEDHSESNLANLVSLASLAVPAGRRKPLLDVRYHQMARGVSSVGVCLTGDPQDELCRAKLLASDQSTWKSDDGQQLAVFSLGVCRNCGQPFLMGYAEVKTIDQGAGTVPLSRISKPQQEYLHAVAWTKGIPVDDADQKEEDAIYFNRFTGQIRCEVPPVDQDGWCRGVWYCSSQKDGNPEFLRECPCCRETRNEKQGVRHGLITPYEAGGSQFRIRLLDALYQLADPSMNPAARNHPGEGRKLLAFSDSRRGAASLALEQQEFWADTTMSRLVPEAIKQFDVPPQQLVPEMPELSGLLGLLNGPNCTEQMRPVLLAQIKQMIESFRGTLKCEAIPFRMSLEGLNCARLLELADQAGRPLSPSAAAQVRMLLSLRKKSRYSIIQRGIVRLDSKALLNAKKSRTGTWNHALMASKLDDDLLASLCGDIYRTLFEQARLQIPEEWKNHGINSLFHKEIKEKESGESILRFATTHSLSRLNKIVQKHTKRNVQDAGVLLQDLWPLFAQAENDVDSPLVDTGNGVYQLRLEDILFQVDSDSDNEVDAEPAPQERYDSELMTRPLLPLRVEEHTAQISKEKGAAYQRAYSEGMINILSCSTTFEMGVDLGDLGLVFLSNLPPLVSNYRQRAGRAGRRPGAPAYVVSFVGDAPHDRYYFDHASELLFGRVQPPKIYLSNPIFRARHLRAEAMHLFLKWIDDSSQWQVDGRNPCRDNTDVQIYRNWKLVGYFFQGLRAGRHNKQPAITGEFSPIVDELTEWIEDCSGDVQNHCSDIFDVPELNYAVCEDLMWQLKTQAATWPYDRNDAEDIRCYQELGGPNQPQLNENGDRLDLAEAHTSRELQYRVKYMYDGLGRGNQLTPSQRHLLLEGTIEWLSRNRVLPKYGFPCDVIRMVSAENDVYGADVKLDRDLKVGLYEYAPGQTVIADKRAYTSKLPLVYTHGGLQTALQDATHPFHQCANCHAVFGGERPEPFTCNLCRGNHATSLPSIVPDAFLSEPSQPARVNRSRQSGAARQQLYTGGYRQGSDCHVARDGAALFLRTVESDTGEILYINMGPRYQGFDHSHTSYALYHRVKTDVAIWLLPSMPDELTGNRKRNAMRSALEAVLRSISLECGVSEREVGGLVHDVGQDSFVLYDESSGGGGTVLPLVLTGNPETDRPRNKLIMNIIDRAIGLCQACPECGDDSPPDRELDPIDMDEHRVNADNEANRSRESCYHCLRRYSNQRRHHLLDRWDAVIVLEAMKTDM